jgi:hypothetical protein
MRMHAIFFLIFGVVAIVATTVLVKTGKAVNHLALSPVFDPAAASYARADAAIAVAREQRQHARAHCVSASSGRAIAVEVLGVSDDGALKLRRRGHPHSAVFSRPASAMFSR